MWFSTVILFSLISISEELKVKELIRIFFVRLSKETFTDDAVVPIPTERFGTIFNWTKSSFLRLCAVDTDTVVSIDCTVAVILDFSGSKKYVSLSAVLPLEENCLKYTSLKASPIPVLIPMTFLDLFTT